jgi:hypothetical protein
MSVRADTDRRHMVAEAQWQAVEGELMRANLSERLTNAIFLVAEKQIGQRNTLTDLSNSGRGERI